jgi:hypothetical protein
MDWRADKNNLYFLYTSGKCKIHDTWRRRKNYIASEEYPVTFNYFCLPQLHCSSGWVTTTRPNITYSSPNWAHTCCNNKWKKSAGRSFEKRSCKVFPSCGQSLRYRLHRTNRQCMRSNVAVTHRGLRVWRCRNLPAQRKGLNRRQHWSQPYQRWCLHLSQELCCASTETIA